MPLFFFKCSATPQIYPLSLPDALPIWFPVGSTAFRVGSTAFRVGSTTFSIGSTGSEENTPELQSRPHPVCRFFFLNVRPPPKSTPFPYPTLFRSGSPADRPRSAADRPRSASDRPRFPSDRRDRKRTRLNSSHGHIPYAAFFF